MVKIEWQQMPPRKGDEVGEERCFPRMMDNGVTAFSELCEKAAKKGRLKPVTLKAAFTQLFDAMVEELQEGKAVTLKELGTLRLSIGTTQEVTTSTPNRNASVCVKGVNFQENKDLLKAIGQPDFCSLSPHSEPAAPKAEDLAAPLLQYLAEHGSISRRTFQSLFCLKEATAKVRLRQLVEQGIVRQVGRNRETVYEKVE